MTAKTQAAPAIPPNIVIGWRMQHIIEHMLKDEEGEHYCTGIAAALHVNPGTLSPLLQKMEDGLWLTAEWRKPPAGRPRKFYRFTEGTADMLRQTLAE